MAVERLNCQKGQKMIVYTTNRVKVIYTRTNRKVKWAYSEYCGRWETEEEAIEKAKEFNGNQPFEYRIEDMETDEVMTGFVNWKK